MKHLLSVCLVLAIWSFSISAKAQDLPNCLCGKLPQHLAGEAIWNGPMVNVELGIAFINMMVRGTGFVNSKKAEVDIGLSFMYPIHRIKSFLKKRASRKVDALFE